MNGFKEQDERRPQGKAITFILNGQKRFFLQDHTGLRTKYLEPLRRPIFKFVINIIKLLELQS